MPPNSLIGLAKKIEGLHEADVKSRRINTTIIAFYAQATHLVHDKIERITTKIVYYAVQSHMNSPIEPEGPPMDSHIRNDIISKHSGVPYQHLSNFLMKHDIITSEQKRKIHKVSNLRNKVVHDYVGDAYEEEAVDYVRPTLELIEKLDKIEQEVEVSLQGSGLDELGN